MKNKKIAIFSGTGVSRESGVLTFRDCAYFFICINTGEIYNSQIEAAIKLNLTQQSISRVCKKERKTYKGLIFMFYDEYVKINNIK